MRIAAVVMLAGGVAAQVRLGSTVPGWRQAGSNRWGYSVGVDRESFHSGAASAAIRCSERCEGFGTLMQRISAADYHGRRVRFSAWVRSTGGVRPRIWMRIDGPDGHSQAFDNMDNRARRGPFDWTEQTIVLDVPVSAVSINFGLILDGRGAAWLDDTSLEVVDPKTRLTGDQYMGISRKDREAAARRGSGTPPASDSVLGGIARSQANDPAIQAYDAERRRIVNPGFEDPIGGRP